MTKQDVCKIADFGMAYNKAYEDLCPCMFYTAIIPPELTKDVKNFSSKSDVYVNNQYAFGKSILIATL